MQSAARSVAPLMRPVIHPTPQGALHENVLHECDDCGVDILLLF
jgi:hypothetical protein